MANLQKIAAEMGFQYDKGSKILFGAYQGYTFAIDDWASGNSQICRLTLPVSREGRMPDASWAKGIAKSTKVIIRGGVSGFVLSFTIRSTFTWKSLMENVRETLRIVTNACVTNGYQSCDEQRGQACTPNVCYVSGDIHFLDDVSFGEISYEKSSAAAEEQQRSENIPAGCLGAILGSIVGGAIILLVAQLGYVSIAGGICMGMLTMWGYQKMAGKLTVKGIVIGAVCIIVMTWFAERMDWALAIFKEIVKDDGGTLAEAYKMQDMLLEAGSIKKSAYISSFAQVYLYSVIGAVLGIISIVSKDRQKNVARKIG